MFLVEEFVSEAGSTADFEVQKTVTLARRCVYQLVNYQKVLTVDDELRLTYATDKKSYFLYRQRKKLTTIMETRSLEKTRGFLHRRCSIVIEVSHPA